MASPATDGLESRIRALEVSLRRAHRIAAVLGALFLLVAFGAWRAEDKVETQTLVLTNPAGHPAAVLRAGPVGEGPSLVLESPEGVQVMRLGGPAARQIRR